MFKSLVRRNNLTTLSNGLRICSDNSQGHFNSVGVYVHAGSRFERPQNSGLSHIVDRLAFKSTTNRTEEDMTNLVNKIGGNIMCSSSRETIMYQSLIFKNDLNQAMDLISDTMLNPNLSDLELDYQKQSALYEIMDINSKPDLILPELVHHTAYKNNTLGNPLLCPEENLQLISPNLIQQYLNQWFRPERLVVAGCGVEHDQLVNISQKYFGNMKPLAPLDKELANESPIYTGGELYLEDRTQDMTHIYIAFEGVGIHDDDVYALAVMQMLLGGGGSFSAGMYK